MLCHVSVDNKAKGKSPAVPWCTPKAPTADTGSISQHQLLVVTTVDLPGSGQGSPGSQAGRRGLSTLLLMEKRWKGQVPREPLVAWVLTLGLGEH